MLSTCAGVVISGLSVSKWLSAAGRPSLEGSDGAVAALSAEDREEEHRPLSVSLSAVTLGPGWMWDSSHIRTRVCTHAHAHRRTHGTLGRELTAVERAGGIEIAYALHRPFFLKEGVRVPERERGGSVGQS